MTIMSCITPPRLIMSSPCFLASASGVLLVVRVCEQEVIGKIEIVVSTRTLRQDVRDLVASFDHEEINLETAYMLVSMKASQNHEVVRTREFPRKVISSVTHPSPGLLPSLKNQNDLARQALLGRDMQLPR
jgi:hypothetical protein